MSISVIVWFSLTVSLCMKYLAICKMYLDLLQRERRSWNKKEIVMVGWFLDFEIDKEFKTV